MPHTEHLYTIKAGQLRAKMELTTVYGANTLQEDRQNPQRRCGAHNEDMTTNPDMVLSTKSRRTLSPALACIFNLILP